MVMFTRVTKLHILKRILYLRVVRAESSRDPTPRAAPFTLVMIVH